MANAKPFGVSLLVIAMQCADVYAASCTETVDSLKRQYNDTRENCGRASSPAFLCTGVIFRATVPSDDYNSWDPSPASVKSGGTSFSYVRKDAKFTRLVRNENNGYMLFPILALPAGKSSYNVLCSFPMDGGTDARTDKGCGSSPAATAPGKGAECYSQRIVTGRQWAEQYKMQARGDNRNGCGFDVRDALDRHATDNFNASLSAMRELGNTSFKKQNELRLDTWSAETPDGNLPIQAFFYLPKPGGGKEDAQFDQQHYYSQTGVWAPIVAMTLPDSPSQEATFSCDADDQAVPESGETINRFVQSATWELRPDPGTGEDEWTLSVALTELGRTQKGSSGSNAVYAELVRQYKNDFQWKQNDGGGMRRQLVCHFNIARNKDVFNLEPFRPDVSEAEAEAAGCNPV